MGEIRKTVTIRILFCSYCCRKCFWLFCSNMLYETALETVGSLQRQRCYLGVKINRNLLTIIQFLCIALENGRARLCIRLSWVKVGWSLWGFPSERKILKIGNFTLFFYYFISIFLILKIPAYCTSTPI